MDLASHLNPYALPAFDYGALNDPEVERQLRETVAEIQTIQRTAVVDIGRKLIAVKDMLPHGSFLPWVESFGMERRAALRAMQVADVFGTKWDTVSHLPISVVYKLAAPSTPDEVRDLVLQKIGPGKGITVRDVSVLIDQVDRSEARKRRKDHFEEERQQREAYNAKWEAQAEKDRKQRRKDEEAARDAAEKMRFMLGAYFSEVYDLLATVDHRLFAEEFVRLAKEYRNHRPAEERL